MKLMKFGPELERGTNVNSIEIPDLLRQKHSTGIEWVDAVLGGGLTPSIAMMLTGDPGAGKSTLIRTIANGLTSQGHVVLYNCVEESPFMVKLACERLGLSAGFVIGDDIFVQDVIDHANELAKNLPEGKRVFLFVDSLQMLDDGKYDTGKTTKQTPVNCAKALIEWAKKTMNVVGWVHQVTKSGAFVGDNTVKHAVDMHVHFGFDRDKKSPFFGERILSKNKDRFGPACDAIVMDMLSGGRLAVKQTADYDDVSSEDDEVEIDEAAE